MPTLEELRSWLRTKGAHGKASTAGGARGSSSLLSKGRYSISIDGKDAVLKRGFGIYDGEMVSVIVAETKGRRFLIAAVNKEPAALNDLGDIIQYQIDLQEGNVETAHGADWDPDVATAEETSE